MATRTIDELRTEAFLKLPEKVKQTIFNKAGETYNLPAMAIEKDWWVTQILQTVFGLPYADKIQFKGGTSLSKGWNLIERFSEDVDLAIDREFLGFGGNISKNQISDKLRRKSKQFIIEQLLPDIKTQLKRKGITENILSININDNGIPTQDPLQIVLEYPSLYITDSYIPNKVLLEITGRSNDMMVGKANIKSMIDQSIPGNKFEQKSFKATIILPERTFIEKICLLHEEFNKSHGNIRHERMSRHLYDLYSMCKKGYDKTILNDENSFIQIIAHRFKFNRIDGVDYDTESPGQFNIIPSGENLALWKKDYEETMLKMIYSLNPPSFDEIISRMIILNADLNNMKWKNRPHFEKGGESVKSQINKQKTPD